jgi:predicted secreted hydrolase
MGCERARLRKNADGSYDVSLGDASQGLAARLRFTPKSAAQRYGQNGLLDGRRGVRLFHYFLPRFEVSGEVFSDGTCAAVVEGLGGYDRKLARAASRGAGILPERLSWISASIELDDGSLVCLYQLDGPGRIRLPTRWLSVIDPVGRRRDFRRFHLRPLRRWRSLRTFQEYEVAWRLEAPDAGLDLTLTGSLDDQEIMGVIGTPMTWAGRAEVAGAAHRAPVQGAAFVETNSTTPIDRLDRFFAVFSALTLNFTSNKNFGLATFFMISF